MRDCKTDARFDAGRTRRYVSDAINAGGLHHGGGTDVELWHVGEIGLTAYLPSGAIP